MALIIAQSVAIAGALQRSLRGRAHALRPVVMVGAAGLTPAVLHEIDVNLKAHELIKIKLDNNDRDVRVRMLRKICAELGALLVQEIGKVGVLYRAQKNKPANAAHAARPKPPRVTKRGLQGHTPR